MWGCCKLRISDMEGCTGVLDSLSWIRTDAFVGDLH